MTQARARKPQKKASIKTTKSPVQPGGTIQVDTERFEVLWLQFEDEAGLTAGHLDNERKKLQEEVANLQAKIDEKQQVLDAVENRAEAAKHQMRTLLSARLSDDAILSAMRVEYKVRKTGSKGKKDTEKALPAADEDKQFVLDQLDAEGLSVADLKKLTNKDARFLRSVLESLLRDGKVIKSGDKASAKYHLS